MPRSRPWIRTLVDDGLLDVPEKHGRSGQRGGREDGTWSETQFRLYLAELEQIRQGRGRAELCHLPVRLWLRLGPDRIPVRQIRRALRTYSRFSTSKRQARITATQLAKVYSGGDVTRRGIKDLSDASAPFDPDRFHEAARRLIDPENTGRTLGPPGARIGTETHVLVVEAYLTGIAQLDSVDESTFEAVRHLLLQRTQRYTELHPSLVHHREVGDAFATITPQTLLKQPCPYVLMILGRLSREWSKSVNETDPVPNDQVGRTNDKSARRLRQQPRATTHGEEPSACTPSVPPPRRAASS